ncbi:MAG: hypothetical protein ACK5P7_13820 [Bdellovibrio sp.]|jgi:hypothetical protein
MKTTLLLAATLSASISFGAIRDVTLTKQCEASLKATALQMETAKLAADGEVLASELESTIGLSYWPAKEHASVSVRLEDPIDGRSILYSAKVLKSDALQCKIALKRNDDSFCRYSRSEGPSSMTEIPGITWAETKDIKVGDRMSALEEKQIQAFLGEGRNEDVNELIDGTDDHEVNFGTLTLPDGRELTYLGAYGGDNPHGIFFAAGTTTVQGANGDGSVCVQ